MRVDVHSTRSVPTRLDVQLIHPRDDGFYSKRLDYHGIAIKAHHVVHDEALREVHGRLDRMLSRAPAIRKRLAQSGVEFHIIGVNQLTSDLPEGRKYKGRVQDGVDWDERNRGLWCAEALAASCGEENLLPWLPDPRREHHHPAGHDIAIHEFAHAIHFHGLTQEQQARVHEVYERSIASGHWHGTYAGENEYEFFAELTMWYFGRHHEGGAQELLHSDRDAYELLDDIYGGREVLSAVRVNQARGLKSGAGAPVDLALVNERTRPVGVAWLDFQGNPGEAHWLAPGERMYSNTFVSHPFLVYDEKGAPDEIFVAKGSAALGIIR
jgi:hypothetical protein